MEAFTPQEASKEANVDKISVWWDIENCHVPKEVDPENIALNIGSALRKANLGGPISISAYGDTQLLKREVQQKLTSTGINLHHIPSGQKDASDKAILVGMLLWALDNPPPAHILLISGDRDFSNALHRLRMKTYDILLARPAGVNVSTSLLAAASSVWIWSSLAKGEDINDAKIVTSKEHPIHQASLITILKAIETLQMEMMLPTEENIYSCIKSGVKPLEYLLFRKTLSEAIEMRELRELMVKTAGSEQVQFFLPWNMELWVCVDPELSYDYSVDIWKDFCAFLCSHEGKIALSNSKTRYDAALTLRNSGPPRMRSLALAQLVNIIQISITVKEWLKPHPTLWFPVHIVVDESENSYLKQPGPVRKSVSVKSRQNPDIPSTILKSLRSWLVHVLSTGTFEYGYALSLLERDFESATKVKLEPSMLGFSGLLELVQSFSDVVWIKQRNGVYFLFPVSRSPSTLLKASIMPLISSSNIVNTPHENKTHLKQLEKSNSWGFRTMQPNPKIVLEKLRTWLSMLVYSTPDGYDVRSLWESFRTAYNFNFNFEALGFSSLQDVFKQFPDLVRLEYNAGNWMLFSVSHTSDNRDRTPKPVSGEGCIQTAAISSNLRYGKSCSKLVADCETILKEVLPAHPKGYPQSKLGDDFRKRFGYELDYRHYGFQQLSDLISCISERVIISAGKHGEQLIHLADEHLLQSLKSINLNQLSAKGVLNMDTPEVIRKSSTMSKAGPFQKIEAIGPLTGEVGEAHGYSPSKVNLMHAFMTEVFGSPT